MSRSLFWLSDEAWAAIEPHLPKNQPGARRVDDRRVISASFTCSSAVAVGRIALPNTALQRRSIIDGTGRTTKIHALVDVLGRPLRLVLTPGNTSDVKGADLLIGETIGMKRVIADRGYDANRIRTALREQGTIPVIPGRRNRKRPIQYDERRYKDRCRLKDFRRIATRYDKLARNFLSAVHLAAAIAFWL